MAWKIVRITIEMEDPVGGQSMRVLEGNDLKNYIGIGWGILTGGKHKKKHIFDPSIFPPDPNTAGATTTTSKSGAVACQLKEPNCGVKDLP